MGVYSVASKIAEGFNFIPWTLTTAMFFLLSRSYRNSEAEFRFVLQFQNDLLFVISICIVSFMLVGSGFIIREVFGGKYLDSIRVLEVYLLVVPFWFLNSINTRYLVLIGHGKWVMYRAISLAFINCILNLFLIPMFGVMGAVYSTILSEIILYFMPVFFPDDKRMFKCQLSVIGALFRIKKYWIYFLNVNGK